ADPLAPDRGLPGRRQGDGGAAPAELRRPVNGPGNAPRPLGAANDTTTAAARRITNCSETIKFLGNIRIFSRWGAPNFAVFVVCYGRVIWGRGVPGWCAAWESGGRGLLGRMGLASVAAGSAGLTVIFSLGTWMLIGGAPTVVGSRAPLPGLSVV